MNILEILKRLKGNNIISPLPSKEVQQPDRGVSPFLQKILGAVRKLKEPVTVRETFDRTAPPAMTTPTATPTPVLEKMLGARTPTREDYEEIIKRGLGHWGDVPAKQWAGTFAQAPEMYPIYQKHPYLPAAVSILESSGGKNMTYANNPMNWGIRIPSFKPQSPEEAIMKMITGVGGRMAAYEPFRQSQDLSDFANTYAPPCENETAKYIENLGRVFDVFKEAEEGYFNEQ